MVDVQLMGLLNATLQAATLLFIAALGELITEKAIFLAFDVDSFGKNNNLMSRGRQINWICLGVPFYESIFCR